MLMGKPLRNRSQITDYQITQKLHFLIQLTKMKTPGFTLSKTKVYKTNSKIVSIESSNQLFFKISIISQKHNIDMEMLLTYPMGCVPLSLAEADASLRKQLTLFFPPCLKTVYEEIELPNIYLAKIIGKLRVGRFCSKSWLVYKQ